MSNIRSLFALLIGFVLASILISIPLLSTVKSAEAAVKAESAGYMYAINLASSTKPIREKKLSKLEAFDKYIVYITRHREDGKNWYRLRIGFFPNRKTAVKAMRPLLKQYPEAWVTRVSSREKEHSSRHAIFQRDGEKKTRKGFAASKPLPEKELSAIMEEAAKALTAGKYNKAIRLYTMVLKAQDNAFKKEAMELKGLAYERKGNIRQAKAEYKAYLILYPKGEDTERVRQRLAALDTATAKPRKKLKEKKRTKSEGMEVYGSFSQFYNRDESYADLDGNVITRSSLSTDLDLNLRSRSAAYDKRLVLVGGYDWDFLNAGANSEPRLSRLYVDVLNRKLRLSLRAGRQTQSSGGVLGRFDGGLLSLQVIRQAKISLVAGYPVESSVLRSIDTSRYFYGVSLDFGTFAECLDFNLFAIEQLSAGVMDRQAVGGEIRYFHPNRSFFTLVDYDTSYNELNTALFVGNLIFSDKTTINTSIDIRKSPSLSTTNALQGQTADKLKDLLNSLGEDEVRSLALDRTAESRSVSIGITHPVNKKFQIGGDVTVSEVTGTPASGGVEEMPGTGYEYLVSTQLIGSSLLKDGDVSIIGMSYADTSTSRTVSLNLNRRYPINHDWRVNPRFRIDYTKNDLSGSDQLKIRPALKTDYYWKRFISMELEAGAEWAYEWISGQREHTLDYFLIVGYRVDF